MPARNTEFEVGAVPWGPSKSCGVRLGSSSCSPQMECVDTIAQMRPAPATCEATESALFLPAGCRLCGSLRRCRSRPRWRCCPQCTTPTLSASSPASQIWSRRQVNRNTLCALHVNACWCMGTSTMRCMHAPVPCTATHRCGLAGGLTASSCGGPPLKRSAPEGSTRTHPMSTADLDSFPHQLFAHPRQTRAAAPA
jgi:hypothetical protein